MTKEDVELLTSYEKGEYIIQLYDQKIMPRKIATLFDCKEHDIYDYLKIVDIRKCSNCCKLKSWNDFYKTTVSKIGYESICKKCKTNKTKIKYAENPKYFQDNSRQSYENNKEERIKKHLQWFKDHPGEHYKGTKRWIEKNKEYFQMLNREYKKKRMKENPKYRISHNISTYIRKSLNGEKNHQHWEDLVGYSIQDLIIHLESKFDDKMNWDNYGSYWHIDHIVPIAAFNISSYKDEAFKKCWGLQNLQPLNGIENCQKQAFISLKWNNQKQDEEIVCSA